MVLQTVIQRHAAQPCSSIFFPSFPSFFVNVQPNIPPNVYHWTLCIVPVHSVHLHTLFSSSYTHLVIPSSRLCYVLGVYLFISLVHLDIPVQIVAPLKAINDTHTCLIPNILGTYANICFISCSSYYRLIFPK